TRSSRPRRWRDACRRRTSPPITASSPPPRKARRGVASALRGGAALLPGLSRDPLETLGHLGRDDVGREVRELLDLADLDHVAVLGRTAPRPLDRLLLRLRLDQPVAADRLLGLGERAVHDRGLAAGEADARGLGRRVEA